MKKNVLPDETTGKPRQRRGKKHLVTREALLNASSELMIEKGRIDFSLAEITERTGLSAALVQYHFGSKEKMLLALLKRRTDKAQAEMERLREMDMSARDKLRIHLKGLMEAYRTGPYVNRLLHALMQSGDPDQAAFISDIFIRPVVEFQAGVLEQGKIEGIFRDVDPTHFYFTTVGACEHLVARPTALRHAFAKDELSKEMTDSFVATLCDIVLKGIEA